MGWLISDDLEKLKREELTAYEYFEALYRHFLGGAEEIQ
jgi:hypothetical protein